MIELTMESPVTILIMLFLLLLIVLALGAVYVLKDVLNICSDGHEEIQREYRERHADES